MRIPIRFYYNRGASTNASTVLLPFLLRLYLYPRHLCRGVYSFRFSVRPFVCSFVRLFVRSFFRSYFLPSRGICVKVLR